MNKSKNTFALICGLLLVFAVLWGCVPSSSVDGDTMEHPTDAVDTGGQESTNIMQTSAVPETRQLRLTGTNRNLSQEDFFVADSEEDLYNGLSDIGIFPDGLDLDDFDNVFFQEYRLVVIPGSSRSGSVKYHSETAMENGIITITLYAEMPEAGTFDMADWLIFVPLPRDIYGETVEIVLANGKKPEWPSKPGL